MKIDTSIEIKNPQGTVYETESGKLTLKEVIVEILSLSQSSNPQRSYNLVNEFKKKEVELKAEDIVFIKEIVLKSNQYYPYIIGQALDILDK